MIFADIAHTFDKLEHTASRIEMTKLLSVLYRQLSVREIDKVSYLLQGRVAPVYEKLDFGLAERLVFKAAVNAFSLSEKEAKREWEKGGDLGIVIEKYRGTANLLFQNTTPLSVSEVFELLYKIPGLSGSGSQEGKLGVLADLFQQLDPLSCRYVVRMVTAKLRLGFSDMTVLDAFSWMLSGDKQHRKEIERAYNVHPDLGFIGRTLKEAGVLGLEHVKPIPGVPILMARAERVPEPEVIFEKIGSCAVEPKYDGFRLQIHVLKTHSVHIYSRNMENVAFMYPDIVAAAQKELGGHEVIIEGEAIGYDLKNDHYLPFQETVQRKRKHDIASKSVEIPLRLFAFDLLYCDGESYLTKGYQERRQKLHSIVSKNAEVISVTKVTIAENAGQIEQLFRTAISEGLEGIMAKKLDGTYEAGARGWNWIKFKHSYGSRLVDTLDCVVMGYDYGQGKRTGFGIGAFLVGVFNKKTDKFVTVAKIGTGLTDDEWRSLKTLCNKHAVKERPAVYDVNKELSVDQWVQPAVVVEIRADELTRSTMHTALLALRFPRLEKFRADKSANEVSELTELQHMSAGQKRVAL
ncbi:MAG: ATP-dependent DNA ligase [Patescibacteria group bacterium]|jgi:DNA ligase-1